MPRLIDLQARLSPCPKVAMRLSTDEVLITDARSGMMPGDFVEKKLTLVIDRSDGGECCAHDSQRGARAQQPSHPRESFGAAIAHRKLVGILIDRDIVLALRVGEAELRTALEEVTTKEFLTIWDDQGIFNETQ